MISSIIFGLNALMTMVLCVFAGFVALGLMALAVKLIGG